jgi:2,3,4,5-tetrahydropyridine-2-carboxylate N-succinyltransferase
MIKDRMQLETFINQAWEEKDQLSSSSTGEFVEAIRSIMVQMDSGKIRVAEKINGHWTVNEWAKKAILLSFKINDCFMINDPQSPSFDKIPLKFDEWNEDFFAGADFRIVPGAIVRHSAYIGKNVVMMPSFTNVGAFIDDGTMVDTGARIGSCAQVGANCHISGGVGLGGVLEPLQASPVIIEDNCFIGATSEIAEGVIVEEGSVIGMNVMLGSSTKIVNRDTGEISYGRVPPYSVVVPGSLPGKALPNGEPGPSLACAVIIKQVDEKTRSKTSINELLR